MRFDCTCGHGFLLKTDNSFTTNEIRYDVYICENCKEYYVKRFSHLCGVVYDYKQSCWMQNGVFLKNQIV